MTLIRAARPVIRAPRRARQWAIRTVNTSIVAATHAGQTAIELLGILEGDLGQEFHNITVGALNFNVDYRLTNSSAGDDTTVAMGICWVGQDAFDIGGTSLPDPSDDHYDWMFHDIRTMSSSVGVTDVDEMVRNSHLVIRNRSMRKQRENHSTLVMIFRAILLQPTSLQIFIGGRSLVIFP